jgi:hypothetical protein
MTSPLQLTSQQKHLPATNSKNNCQPTTTSANNSKHNCQPTTTSQPHFGLSRHGTRTLDDFTAGERVIPSEPLAGFEGQGVRMRRGTLA